MHAEKSYCAGPTRGIAEILYGVAQHTPPIVESNARVYGSGQDWKTYRYRLCEEWGVEAVPSGAEGIYWAAHACADAIVIACPLPDMGVSELLEELARLRTKALILVYDPAASVTEAVRCMRLGAHDVAGPDQDIARSDRRGYRDAARVAGSQPGR